MSAKGKRLRRAAAEKVRIVLAGLDGTIEISEMCRREGISPTQYYGWKRHLLNSATKVFESSVARSSSGREVRLEAELTQAKNVIAEITAENLDLKKGTRVRGLRPVAAGTSAGGRGRVHKTKERSDWPVRRTLAALGVSPTS
jgi:transposase-like protein